eukprot:TRINITY_DN40_c0_g2_i7.p1 TRINITY_DN40_c0_g2~~TRINITY_DN40_c0_g2_i7.p1  ORF type:complete len:266 (+),score=26.59 TRINITY_DN40_c0_g2_i7:116-799(+)
MPVGNTLRFCPDKEAVEAWSIENERVYAAMYLLRDELMTTEREIFERMSVERKLKLSVHPWHKFPTLESLHLLERRRKQGSAATYKCVGTRIDEVVQAKKMGKPTKFAVQLMHNGEQMLNYASVKYGDTKIDVGHWDNHSTMIASKLPACVQYVFVKSYGDSITGVQFYSHKNHSRMFGWDMGESIILVAPEGKCLGDMKLIGEDKLSKICLKFNVNKKRIYFNNMI